MSGSYQDKDNPPDGKVAWYPDPAMPNEKPPKGQNPDKVESIAEDTPSSSAPASGNTPYGYLDNTKPYASVSSIGEATAELNNEFTNTFGSSAPKELLAGYAKELRNLQASRSSARITGKTTDIIIQGVSPQERKDILNKYLKTYATNQVQLAAAGDAKAVAAIQKGNFGLALTSIKNAYSENGLPSNFQSIAAIATESALNPDRLKANLNLINMQAKTYFPALADKIDKGFTVKQLLSPYIQTRANILEEDPESVDISSLKDVAKDPNNLMGLYEYEVSLRKDPKWRFTKNAQDSIGNVARTIATTFGLMG